MVDFDKRIGKKNAEKIVDPIKLYDSLDRASDKGPLRPVQKSVIRTWFSSYRKNRDVILKLHTGQGKTLLGLLMLQSKLNEGVSPALYLCPNHLLVNQTIEQARQFGIRCVTTDDELPDEFIEGRAILVTVIHKLFNGLTKFKIGAKSISVGSIVIDDSHACIDAIKDQFVIKLRHNFPNESNAYSEILGLFEKELRNQGEGSFEDVCRNDYNAYLPVPYWDWWDKTSEVAGILSRHAKTDAVKFAWPLVRDSIRHTYCLVSGTHIAIAPYLTPIEQFGSYANANHRIFMSASVTDDSFLVKGLGLGPTTVKNPLVDPDEKWSGEKMVLLPSLIDEHLSRANIVATFAKENFQRKFGAVVLVPGEKRCGDWEKYGARVVNKFSISSGIEDLYKRSYSKTLVIANYYDGIDLPDDTCRILIIDSRPFADELLERYIEDRRHGSSLISARIARIVEQGMGRSVRGEKDYCVIILIGSDLIRALQAPGQREFFSEQTRMQISLGKEIAEFAKEEIADGKDPKDALHGLINQCLKRDSGWKRWYTKQMNKIQLKKQTTSEELLDIFQSEVNAEKYFQNGNFDPAVQSIQGLLDKHTIIDADKGWYLQEMARYTYAISKSTSNELQRNAHKNNRALLRPKEGMIFTKVKTLTPDMRLERIHTWMKSHDSFENMASQIDDILTTLTFSVIADRFEQALQEIASALGFESDRPEKEWKAGPDNLWGLRDNQYILFECKSEVEITRAEINKGETDQMNRSSAWFKRYYPGSAVTRILIIPPKKLAVGAALIDDVLIMGKKQLNELTKNIRNFFNEFRTSDLRDLSNKRIDKLIRTHKLAVEDLIASYGQKPRAHKGGLK
jgi:replicative superfamily II helicase